MVRRIAVGGLVAALAVALTHLRAQLPNVELTSLAIFMGGFVLGVESGALTGAAAAAALSLSNPLGPPSPALLAAQMLGYASWGALGGWTGGLERRLAWPLWALIGALMTTWFQLLVNLSLVVGTGLTLAQVLVPGLPFAIVHVIWNALAFAALGPVLADSLVRLRTRIRA